MIDYLQRAVAAQISIFAPREIAKLIHQCKGKPAASIENMMSDAYEKENVPKSEKPYELGVASVTTKIAVNAFNIF